VILALRASGIGDLCAVVPALRAIRRSAGDGEDVVLAAPRWLEPLAHLTGVVDRLVEVDGLDQPDRLSGLRPRLAVNLHGCGPQSHRLLRSAEPSVMWAHACAEADFTDGPAWVDRAHEAARWCGLVRWYGLRAKPDDLHLERSATRTVALAAGVPVGATVIHPGAKSPLRRWPIPRFAAVARALAADGHDVVVSGSAQERDLASSVARAAGLPQRRVLAGALDVGGLAALVAHARLVVCGDTGVGHLATAYRTPSVLLFGPMPPSRWGPPPDRPEHRVLWHGARRGVNAIRVTEVLAAVPEAERAAVYASARSAGTDSTAESATVRPP
jgi:ADP-heptose:LPS heptosyltransferase